MPGATRVLTLSLALCLTIPEQASAQQLPSEEWEAQRMALAEEAVSLLETAPLNESGAIRGDIGVTLDEALFVFRTEDLYEDAQTVSALGDRSFATVEEAVVALGGVAAFLGPSTVVVESDPPGLPVKYYDLLQDMSESNLTITTDDSLEVDPMWYFFWAIDPSTGDTTHSLVDCVRGCNVRFNFVRQQE